MRINKIALSLTVAGLLSQASALAICDKNLEQCGTVASGVAVGAGSTIYAVKKFGAADKFEAQNTQVLIDTPQNPQEMDSRRISRLASDLTEGDRVEVDYRLSEEANRQYHIKELTSSAHSQQSSASTYRAQAAAALVPRIETVTEYVDGQARQRTIHHGPDFARYTMLNSMAEDAERSAERLFREAAEARAGGPVPWHRFTKTIDQSAGTYTAVSEFLNGHAAEGGTVLKITRLEAQKFAKYRSLLTKGRIGIVGAAVGLGFAAEEFAAGEAAKRLRAKSRAGSEDRSREYGSGGTR